MTEQLLLVPLPLWNVAVVACLLGLAVLGSHFLREFLRDDIVIRLGGFEWDRQCACQHFLITGATGAGKTLSGVLPILMQFFRNQPRFGGLCIDVKGVLHEEAIAIARHHGRSNGVLVLEVRPPEAGPDWRPPHRFNLVAPCLQAFLYGSPAPSLHVSDVPHPLRCSTARAICQMSGLDPVVPLFHACPKQDSGK